MIGRLFVVLAPVLWLLFPGVAGAGSNGASERMIGLLELPQLFGPDDCTPYDPTPLALFKQATGAVSIGEVRVDTPGGCYNAEIGVHLTDAATTAQKFPTREYGYERRGAIVYARRGNRFRIALRDGAAWVEPSVGVFHPMETLITEGLSYLTASWGGFACTGPGDSQSCLKVALATDSRPTVKVFGHRNIKGRLWFEVAFPVRDACDGPPPTAPTTRGWVPAHGADGTPAIWFYSRGCLVP